VAHASRTVNPLHFEDLEPRRFEDLVRQLLYDFRNWNSLEATGRSGSDDGFDARGWEVVSSLVDDGSESDDDDQESRPSSTDRVWLIQCKRERRITPKKLVSYLQDIDEQELKSLHGLIFVAACDFSKKSHDEFRSWCVGAGLKEFHLWGKAALEDLIFQPRHDHLLFGYFGISLQIRKRSVKSALRARLATKRQVIRHLGGVEGRGHETLLLRDASDEHYPYTGEVPDFHKKSPWAVYDFIGHYESGIKILARSHFAYFKDEAAEWDAMEVLRTNRHFDDRWSKATDQGLESKLREIWQKIPEENRGTLEVVGLVPYDQILAIDEEGDEWFTHPHVYLQCDEMSGFFAGGAYGVIRSSYAFSGYEFDADLSKQVQYFPQKYRAKP
jgi:hypothetical protein